MNIIILEGNQIHLYSITPKIKWREKIVKKNIKKQCTKLAFSQSHLFIVINIEREITPQWMNEVINMTMIYSIQ